MDNSVTEQPKIPPSEMSDGKKKGKRKFPKRDATVLKEGKNYYFPASTKDAIKRFQDAVQISDKHDIFRNEIYDAFSKLAENLITTYKFEDKSVPRDDLKNDTVSTLYEKLCNFDTTRGTNSFSYFNVVARNYLIARCRNTKDFVKKEEFDPNTETTRVSYVKRTFPLSALGDGFVSDDPDEEISQKAQGGFQKSLSSEFYFGGDSGFDIESDENFFRIFHKDILDEISKLTESEKEDKCITAIRQIYEQAGTLPNVSKKAVFFYLREVSGLKPKQLVSSLSKLKKIYKTIRKNKIEQEHNIDELRLHKGCATSERSGDEGQDD